MILSSGATRSRMSLASAAFTNDFRRSDAVTPNDWEAIDFQQTRCYWRLSTQPLPPSKPENASNNRLREVMKALKRKDVKLFDYSLKTCAGREIRAWLFQPCEEELQGQCPCGVVYCPSVETGGADAEEVVPIVRKLAPVGISVLCLDVTRRSDLKVLPEDVMAGVALMRLRCEAVALWGHDQGAVSAIRCAQLDPSLAALVSDSAFCDLPPFALPSWVSEGIAWISRYAPSLKCRATSHLMPMELTGLLDLQEAQVTVLEAAARSFVPALFLHGAADTKTPASHVQAIQKAYGGEAQLILVPHFDGQPCRPPVYIAKAALFLVRAFRMAGSSDVIKTRIQQLEQMSDVRMGPRESKFKASDQEVKEFLESRVGQERRHGVLLAGLNAVEAYLHADAYVPAGVPGRWSQDHLTFQCLAEATLPEKDSSVAIIWAADLPSQGPGGLLFFAFVAPSHISIVRIRVRPGTPDVKAQIYPTRAGMVATVRESMLPREQSFGTAPVAIELTIKLGSNSMELKVGDECLEEKLLDDGGLGMDTSLTEAPCRFQPSRSSHEWAQHLSFWKGTFNKTVFCSKDMEKKADLEFDNWAQATRESEEEFVGEMPKCPWPPSESCLRTGRRDGGNSLEEGHPLVFPSGPRAGAPMLTIGSKCITDAGDNGSLDCSESEAAVDEHLCSSLSHGFTSSPFFGAPLQTSTEAGSASRISSPASVTKRVRGSPMQQLGMCLAVTTSDVPVREHMTLLPVLLASEPPAATKGDLMLGTEMDDREAAEVKVWGASLFPQSQTWPVESLHHGNPTGSWQHEGQMR